MNTIFIGYDRREDEAYRVCTASIMRRSPQVVIRPLRLDTLRCAGLYRRGIRRRGAQMIDTIDGRPFSTEFAFSRFLVPALMLYEGWALGCDCDFLFTASLQPLFAMADDRYAVMCVQHVHEPAEAIKMDGVAQAAYRRKNWSSLVLWNCAHPANRCLTLDCVNRMPGRWLHGFEWLRDDQIGQLPFTWNWLSGVNELLHETPCGIHFTLGGPWFPNCQDVPFAGLWRAERDSRRLPGSGAFDRMAARPLTKG